MTFGERGDATQNDCTESVLEIECIYETVKYRITFYLTSWKKKISNCIWINFRLSSLRLTGEA